MCAFLNNFQRQNSRMNLFPSAVEKKEINDLLMRSNDIPTSALPEKAEINLSDEDDDFLIGERHVDIYVYH
jgi:hypothetical protein